MTPSGNIGESGAIFESVSIINEPIQCWILYLSTALLPNMYEDY